MEYRCMQYSSQAADVSALLNQNDLNDLVRDLGFNQGKSGALIFKIETMEYVLERNQLLLFSFQTRKFSRFFFLSRIMCVIAAALAAFLKHCNLSIIPISGGCLLIHVKQT